MEKLLFDYPFTSNFKTILSVKFYNFSKRSIYRYALASLLIALGLFGLQVSTIFLALIFFLGCILLSFVAMYIIAKIQAKKHTYSGKIQFFEDKLLLLKEENIIEKEISWTNIKLFSDKKDYFMLKTNELSPFYIFLEKSKFSVEAIEFLKTKLL
jgi:hypothetical protein